MPNGLSALLEEAPVSSALGREEQQKLLYDASRRSFREGDWVGLTDVSGCSGLIDCLGEGERTLVTVVVGPLNF